MCMTVDGSRSGPELECVISLCAVGNKKMTEKVLRPKPASMKDDGGDMQRDHDQYH